MKLIQFFSTMGFFKSALLLGLVSLIVVPSSGLANYSDSNNLNPLTATKPQQPDFSGTGRPGRQTAGESRGSCPPTNIPLTALMPNTNLGKTVSDRPTFWFYVPYTSQQASKGEFVIQDEARNDIARIPLSLAKTPGFISFTVPETAAHLKTDQWYRWYFKLYCQKNQSDSAVFVHGWVQRIALTPTLETQVKAATPREDAVYAANKIWYDALAHLGNLRSLAPTDTTLKQDWDNLLKAKGVELELPDSAVFVTIP